MNELEKTEIGLVTYSPTSAGHAGDLLLLSDDARPNQVQFASAFAHSSVDVDALLNTLHTNSIAADPNTPTVQTPFYCRLVDLESIMISSNSELSSGNCFGRGIRDELAAPLLRI